MNKKRVIFVEPRGARSNVFDKFMTIPLLGPVYLGTIAKEAGFDVQILNENILKRDVRPEELDCDILCLTCLTTNVNRGKEIARTYKSYYPQGHTILGGIHASMVPADVVNNFDQVIVGEGENILLGILSGKIKDKIVHNKIPTDMDQMPKPDFTLIKDWKKMHTLPVMTSRGCPFDCNFCSVTEMFGKGYRMMSTDNVMNEISNRHVKDIFFCDDNFAANRKRTNELLDKMLKSDFNLPWSTQVRTDITKFPKLVAKMKKANCSTVYVGIESINPKSLIEMQKSQTVEDIKRAMRVFHDNGIMVHGMFMFGNDSDTKSVFRNTSDFVHDAEIDTVQYAVLTPLPGTRTFHKLEQENRLLHKNWDVYDGLHAVFKPIHMTPEELQAGMLDCFSDFYSYTNAINNALNTFADTGIAAVKNLYSRAHFPSLKPSFAKFFGRGIVKAWLKHNRDYLDYLKTISERMANKVYF